MYWMYSTRIDTLTGVRASDRGIVRLAETFPDVIYFEAELTVFE